MASVSQRVDGGDVLGDDAGQLGGVMMLVPLGRLHRRWPFGRTRIKPPACRTGRIKAPAPRLFLPQGEVSD